LNPPGVHPPQAHYSHVARAGQTLYISGQLAMDSSGAVVGVGDARAQARQCYANLTAILAHYGGRLGHLVKTTTYITHWAYRPLVAAAPVVRGRRFPILPRDGERHARDFARRPPTTKRSSWQCIELRPRILMALPAACSRSG